MRVGRKGRGAYGETDLGSLEPGRRLYLALSYTPGRLTLYRDGEEVLTRTDLRGDFFHWRPYALTLGDRPSGGAAWRGAIEALALYDRPLDAEEVRLNAIRLGADGN